LVGLCLLLVPFLDRGVVRHGRSTVFTLVGCLGVAYIVVLTAWGYHSPVPVYIALAAGVLAFLLTRGTRGGG
jgi:quinol-cytochrome oxidoreductase complex cytochrome b subunit